MTLVLSLSLFPAPALARVSGGFSGGSSTGGGFSSTDWRVTDDGMADNMRFLYRMLGYSVSGNGVVTTNGSGILGVLIRIGYVLDGIWSDTGQISEDVAQSESLLRSILTSLGSDGALAGLLRLGNTQRSSIITMLSEGGTVHGLLQSVSGSSSSSASSLGSIVTMLGSDGLVGKQISSLIVELSADGPIAGLLRLGNTQRSSIITMFSDGGVVHSLLSLITDSLGSGGVLSGLLRNLTDVVRGLDLSPEVTVDVEGQTEQGLDLLDALLGVLDVAAIASSLSTLSSTLQGSFPFGALFMVASALSVLSASPVAPCFSGSVAGVPIEIDLSPFDSVAALCRGLLLVLYVIGLYHATRDWVFRSGGGDS